MTLGVKGLELLISLYLLVNSKNETTFGTTLRCALFFVRQLERNEISCQITGNGISEGLKFQNFLGEHAPRPPQRGTAFARSKYSPVALYYSPATTILNENPALL